MSCNNRFESGLRKTSFLSPLHQHTRTVGLPKPYTACPTRRVIVNMMFTKCIASPGDRTLGPIFTPVLLWTIYTNTLAPGQHGRHCADDFFNYSFSWKKMSIFAFDIHWSLSLGVKLPSSALVRVMTGHLTFINSVSGISVTWGGRSSYLFDYRILGPFYQHGLTLIQEWLSNHMPSKVWDEIT